MSTRVITFSLLTALSMLTAGCGDVTKGSAPAVVTITLLEASSGVKPDTFGGSLASDVDHERAFERRAGPDGLRRRRSSDDVGGVENSWHQRLRGRALHAEHRHVHALSRGVPPHRQPQHRRYRRAIRVRLGCDLHGADQWNRPGDLRARAECRQAGCAACGAGGFGSDHRHDRRHHVLPGGFRSATTCRSPGQSGSILATSAIRSS